MTDTTSHEEATQEAIKLNVTEGIAGMWHYHLSFPGPGHTSLCGKRTMRTSISLSNWGVSGHLRETWCAECANLRERFR